MSGTLVHALCVKYVSISKTTISISYTAIVNGYFNTVQFLTHQEQSISVHCAHATINPRQYQTCISITPKHICNYDYGNNVCELNLSYFFDMKMWQIIFYSVHFVNPLNLELNPICYLLALLAHHFLHVSRIRIKSLTLRLLMLYTYGAPILDVSRSYTTTRHSR